MIDQWASVYGGQGDRPLPPWIDRLKLNLQQPCTERHFEWHDVFEPEYQRVFVYRLTKREADEFKGRAV